jgi:EAL domain-containing protein (putative c-di-GMP-specific phosphodiesterase class I)
MWMAWQPIVLWSERRAFSYEALMRTDDRTFPHPGAVLDVAERTGRLGDVGRHVRKLVATEAPAAPPDSLLFVNLHSRDLLDDALYSQDAPLSRISHRVVLEITERAAVGEIKELRGRVSRLREMGFRLAIDDLGAGFAGLTSIAQLEPDVVKLDMSLVRGVHESTTKRKLVASMATLCGEMGVLVVAEGVETREERDALVDVGCDLLQGYFFAKPGKAFPAPAAMD